MSIQKVTNERSKHYGEWKVRAQPRDNAGNTVNLPIRYCKGTKNDAKRLYDRLVVEFQQQSTYFQEKQLTLVEAFQSFLDSNKSVEAWEIRTQRDYEYTLRILKEYVPNLLMAKVNELTIQKFIRQFAKDHHLTVATGTVLDKRIRHLRYFFNQSVGSIFAHNPVPQNAMKRWFKKSEMVAPDKKRYFSEQQLHQLTSYVIKRLSEVDVTDSIALIGILIALNTGCRPSEIQALKWDDLVLDPSTEDYDYHVFHLTDSYNQTEGKLTGHLKSRVRGQSRYTLPLDKPSYHSLLNYQDKQTKLLNRYKIKNHGFILLNIRDFKRAKEGRILSQESMNGMLKRICRRLEIVDTTKGISMYTCRHSVASLTAAKGMNIAWSADRLGHSNEVYLKKYVHPEQSLSSKLLNVWLDK
ncbi:tyrosine-type recombinase/integrase [Limosilactobacillus caecicola]|uniref:tyrosine-type recombinase/integrase n=1 Tax=Limosilactobacillus caecicola TaxID=2941332 RepID=UPI00204044AF|nr:site-specific integrase [Limosilactobacillus caecicola]